MSEQLFSLGRTQKEGCLLSIASHLLWSYFQRDLVLGESVAITGNSVLTTFVQMRTDLGIKKKGCDFFNKTNSSLTDVASPLETENAVNQM